MACNLIFNEILLTGFSLPGNRHNRQIDRAAAGQPSAGVTATRSVRVSDGKDRPKVRWRRMRTRAERRMAV